MTRSAAQQNAEALLEQLRHEAQFLSYVPRQRSGTVFADTDQVRGGQYQDDHMSGTRSQVESGKVGTSSAVAPGSGGPVTQTPRQEDEAAQ